MADKAYIYSSLTSPARDAFSIRVLELDAAPTPSDSLNGRLVEVSVDGEYESRRQEHLRTSLRRLPKRPQGKLTRTGRPMKPLPGRWKPVSFPPDVDLAERWKYHEALSYTWGDPANRYDDILLLDEAPLRISKNLSEALRGLRQLDRKRRLWVDAVCINQEDIPERNDQVARMHLIYNYAARVLIWLGNDSDSRDGARSFQFFEWMYKRFKSDRDTLDSRIQRFNAEKNTSHGTVTPDLIHQLLSRRWFSRRWIIQEVLQDSRLVRLHCGKCTLKWDTFDMVVQTWHKETPFRNNLAVKLVHGRFSPDSVLWSLVHFQEFGCQDPRDYIAALLNLRKVALFRVDYSRTVEENYIDFAIAVTQRRGCKQLLQCAARRRCDEGVQNAAGLPSWVPDWRISGPDEERDSVRLTLGNVSGLVRRGRLLELEGVLLRKFTTNIIDANLDPVVSHKLRTDFIRPREGDIVFQAGELLYPGIPDAIFWVDQLVLRPQKNRIEGMNVYELITEYIWEVWNDVTEALDGQMDGQMDIVSLM